MADDNKDLDSIIEENMNSGVEASDVSGISAPVEEGDKKKLLERITVTAPLGINSQEVPAADESTPDVTDEHVAVVIDNGRIEDIAEFQAPEVLYEELIKRVMRYHPSDDISLIEKAYDTARQFHKDQLRKSGEPYIIHPLCVAIILADMEITGILMLQFVFNVYFIAKKHPQSLYFVRFSSVTISHEKLLYFG